MIARTTEPATISTNKNRTEATVARISTVTVETIVSLRVGQVTLLASWRTSRTNFAMLRSVIV